ncbi:MAG: carbamate kinase [Candidatus Marinimicrobia bacterium]|nr:carbamate kinase [Candidatus Neomarinimicrobiota bacterium]
MENITVLALGGNAIDSDSHKEEGRNILKTLNGIEELVRAGPLVITHGNGPQVGRLVEQTGLPLWLCAAQTQGEIGTLIFQNLKRYLSRHKIKKPMVVLQTHSLINPQDPSLRKPSKPIGVFLNKTEAKKLMKKGYRMERDPSKKTLWRRIVPSPAPIDIVEKEAIKILLKEYIVITGGGGGVPVYESADGYVPVEAIIDKDYTSSLIATEIGASKIILLTNVEGVKLNFQEPNEFLVKTLSKKDAENFIKKGCFKTGMKSKVEAGVIFLENGGTEVTIAHTFKLKEVLSDTTGTKIT